MKIAIDISSAVYGTGVSTYCKELVVAINNLKTNHEFVLFAGTLRQRRWYQDWFDKLNLPKNFNLKIIPLSPRMQSRLWNDWGIGKLEWFIGKFDIYHSLDWSLAPTDGKTVITVHDLFFLRNPEIQLHPFAASLEKRLLRARNNRIQAIAVSQSTKKDLVSLIKYDEKLIEVIYEANPRSWKKISDDAKFRQVKSKYKLPDRYLLAVSTQEPRKNLDRLMQAQQKMKNIVPIVLVGRVGWGDKVNNTGNVIRTGYINDDELMTIWSYAWGCVYPSLYEGFGLPILQAFGAEVPVLTSQTSSMVEVAEKAAIYIDPQSIDSIASGLDKLVAMEKFERNKLVEAGQKQVKKFSWDKAARETVAIYERLA